MKRLMIAIACFAACLVSVPAEATNNAVVVQRVRQPLLRRRAVVVQPVQQVHVQPVVQQVKVQQVRVQPVIQQQVQHVQPVQQVRVQPIYQQMQQVQAVQAGCSSFFE